MAAGLLRHRLDAAGADATVISAGLLTEGEPASAHGVDVLAQRGIDLSEHRSQRIATDLLARADLVLAMERRHVREAAVRHRDVFPRAFTLPEFVRRGRAVGPRPAAVPVDDWIARVGAGRQLADLLGDDPADDVADPYGLGRRDYERTAKLLEGLVDQTVALLFPLSERA